MSKGVVAKRYALALFEVASTKQQINEVEQELQLITQILNDNPAFLQFLQHPQIAKEDKKKEFQKAFDGNISEIVMNFTGLLIDRNREDILTSVLSFFVEKANEERGLVDAVVTSVRQLTDEEQQGLANSFEKLLNKKIRIENKIDASIMGGVVVQIGDRLYDGSTKSKLHRIQQKIMQSQVR